MGTRAGLDGAKSRPTGIRSTDRPARSQSELPGPHFYDIIVYLLAIINSYIKIEHPNHIYTSRHK